MPKKKKKRRSNEAAPPLMPKAAKVAERVHPPLEAGKLQAAGKELAATGEAPPERCRHAQASKAMKRKMEQLAQCEMLDPRSS